MDNGWWKHEHALFRQLLSFIGLQLAGDLRVRMKGTAGIPELQCMEVLQAGDVCAAHPCGELGRLLVALDQSALDFLLLGEAGEHRKRQRHPG
jgi:hypothetical protein